jgi:hypothetical protein
MGWYPGKILEKLRTERGMQLDRPEDLIPIYKNAELYAGWLLKTYDRFIDFLDSYDEASSVLSTLIALHKEKQEDVGRNSLLNIKGHMQTFVEELGLHLFRFESIVSFLIDYGAKLEGLSYSVSAKATGVRTIPPEHASYLGSMQEKLQKLRENYDMIQYKFRTIRSKLQQLQ